MTETPYDSNQNQEESFQNNLPPHMIWGTPEHDEKNLRECHKEFWAKYGDRK